MLDASIIAEVRRLLAEGELSQRAVARQLGVSRGTVNAVALGRRPDRPPPRKDDPLPVFNDGPPERCPGCGGMVRMPCLACRIESMRRAGLLHDAVPPEPDEEDEEDDALAPSATPWWVCVAGRVA